MIEAGEITSPADGGGLVELSSRPPPSSHVADCRSRQPGEIPITGSLERTDQHVLPAYYPDFLLSGLRWGSVQ